MSDALGVMEEAEVQAMGLNSIIHAGAVEDNIAVNAILSGQTPQQDKEGRQIISYRQFQELSSRGSRLADYAMWMHWPGDTKGRIVQASKFLKWYGLGWEPVGGPVEQTHAFRAAVVELQEAGLDGDTAVMEAKNRFNRAQERIRANRQVSVLTPDQDANIFFCKDKYEDCPRFFDNQKSLTFHWNKDHGEIPSLRKSKKRE